MAIEDALLYKSSETWSSLLYHSLCVQSFEDWFCGDKGSLRWTLENDYRGCFAIETFRSVTTTDNGGKAQPKKKKKISYFASHLIFHRF